LLSLVMMMGFLWAVVGFFSGGTVELTHTMTLPKKGNLSQEHASVSNLSSHPPMFNQLATRPGIVNHDIKHQQRGLGRHTLHHNPPLTCSIWHDEMLN
jgi:hypothetical protein